MNASVWWCWGQKPPFRFQHRGSRETKCPTEMPCVTDTFRERSRDTPRPTSKTIQVICDLLCLMWSEPRETGPSGSTLERDAWARAGRASWLVPGCGVLGWAGLGTWRMNGSLRDKPLLHEAAGIVFG